MFKPLLMSAAVWPIERLINSVIKSDQHAQTRLGKLSGKQLEIETDSPTFSMCILFIGSEVRLSSFSSEELATVSDAKVSSDTATLFSLLFAKTEDRPLANPRISISGDAQFVQSAFNILQSLDLRWDDLLAPFLGSVTTQGLKTSADEFKQWTEESSKAFKHSVDEYLKEEAKVLPTENGLEEFQYRLDQLRLRIDRAEAKTARLIKQVEPD